MKFALIGYGKMGKEIERVIRDQNQEDEVVLIISEENPADFTIENLRKADVAIEFTQPDAAVSNIYKCFDAGVPVVVGTTAWLHQLAEVKDYCNTKNGTLFFSPNYSIGVNIFWEVNRHLAGLMNNLKQYKVEIEEIHHTEKKDAPSGTAVHTAEVILSELEGKKSWKLSQKPDDIDPEEIPIIAKRLPEVPGTHTVSYKSAVDFIEIKHEAFNRRGFAEGAVAAARFLKDKRGVYEMKDLLKF